MRMSTIPVTKSGIAETESPNIVMPLSVGRPYRRPAITPPRIEIGTRMTKATNASLKEFWSAGQRKSHAGACFVSEVPRSPCRSPCTQSMYCEKSDRFVPSCSLSASTDSWVANGPRTARPTFPGKMLDTAKTIMLSRTSVISARPMRLTRKRATG